MSVPDANQRKDLQSQPPHDGERYINSVSMDEYKVKILLGMPDVGVPVWQLIVSGDHDGGGKGSSMSRP